MNELPPLMSREVTMEETLLRNTGGPTLPSRKRTKEKRRMERADIRNSVTRHYQ